MLLFLSEVKVRTAKPLFLFATVFALLIRGDITRAIDIPFSFDRQTTLVVSQTQYEWWLIRWAYNEFVCQLFIEHEGLPTPEEVYDACGKQIYDEWRATPPCPMAERGPQEASTCPGLYLFSAGSQVREKTITLDLPPPTVWVELEGCTSSPPNNLCENLPSLRLIGEEPLPNEHITAIHAILDGVPYTCEGQVCAIPLKPTLFLGVELEFWADSSFGDSSEHYKAKVRVLDRGVSVNQTKGNWYVDILSTQWRDGRVDSCALLWDAFPPIGEIPTWLETPSEEEFLASEEPYYYLAGRLIAHGFVDATECPSGGLLENGYANTCGLEKARPIVDKWQNQFNAPILKVAQEINLPAMLLKRLFAKESQFWPGEFRIAKEFGLGQITDLGADAILIWNPSFYAQFCPTQLEKSVCEKGYLRLSEQERALLRGALAIQANADCEDCPNGINLTQAELSVTLFAQGLFANCGQVARSVYNATGNSPGTVSKYEDLWRFTLANYHAGPGCTSYALHTTWQSREPLDWEHVSTHFTEACQGAVNYVNEVTK